MDSAAASPAGSPFSNDDPPSPLPPFKTSSQRVSRGFWKVRETQALIDSYQKIWYSLGHDQLCASDWQEVADAVAPHCGRNPAKTPRQCKNQIKRLLNMYDNEKENSHPSTWKYFPKMDAMIGGRGTGVSSSRSRASNDHEADDDDDADGGRSPRHLREVRSKVVGSGAEETAARRASSSPHPQSFSGTGGAMPGTRKRKRVEEAMWEIAMAMQKIADAFTKIESTRMEMAKDMEMRMEREFKLTEKIIDALIERSTRSKVSPDS